MVRSVGLSALKCLGARGDDWLVSEIEGCGLSQPLSESGPGWQVLPDEPPGSLGWWNGHEIVVVALWAADHWEYVTDDWTGSDPMSGSLPAGVADPRTLGWSQSLDGHWHGPSTAPMPVPKSRRGPGQSASRRSESSDKKSSWGWGCATAGCLGTFVVVVVLFSTVGRSCSQIANYPGEPSGLHDPWTLSTTPTVAPTPGAGDAKPFGTAQTTTSGLLVTVHGIKSAASRKTPSTT